MEKEIRPLLDRFSYQEESFGKVSRVYHVSGSGKEFLVVVSGIGKCFAASALSAVLARYGKQIEAVVNVGVGGSLVPEQAGLKSAILGSGYLQHDLDTSPIGDPVAMISGINIIEIPGAREILNQAEEVCQELGYSCKEGKIASGDQFIASEPQKESILERFPSVISIDMESAAFAQIAYCYEKPFASVRFVSDTGHGGEYEMYFPECQKRLTEFVCAYLNKNA